MYWKKVVNSIESGVYCWYLNEKIPTQFPYEEIEVDLISEDQSDKSTIYQFDLQAIESILNKIDLYFIQSIEYIKNCIRKSPELFRLSEEEMDNIQQLAEKNKYIHIPDNNVEQYLPVSVYKFPVSMPNIIFYPDKNWMIRFVESGLPAVNYGHGIGVFFNEKNKITDMKIFQEDE